MIESWNFLQLFDLGFCETLQNFSSFRQTFRWFFSMGNKSCSNKLKLCEVSQKNKSKRCWKFQISILTNWCIVSLSYRYDDTLIQLDLLWVPHPRCGSQSASRTLKHHHHSNQSALSCCSAEWINSCSLDHYLTSSHWAWFTVLILSCKYICNCNGNLSEAYLMLQPLALRLKLKTTLTFNHKQKKFIP